MMPEWTTALPNWRDRVLARESLIPCPPLFPDEAAASMAVFDSLRVIDAAGEPTIGESRAWIRDFAATIFGAYDAESGRRLIREFMLLVSKKNGKSTIAAAIMLTALVRNWRRSAEFLIVAPTLEVANNSFKPALDMVLNDPTLTRLIKPNPFYRSLEHRLTGATLRVIAADRDTITGKKATGVLIDELWLFGKRQEADALLREITGGLVSRPEGFVIYLSTQSDEPPSGTFKTKLHYFRQVRDGEIADPRSLPVLYEFPPEMVSSGAYQDPAITYVTNPNLGVSVDQEWLVDEYRKAEQAGLPELRVHCSKHLNVEIGVTLYSDAWLGAQFWQDAADETLDLDSLINRSDVAVVGIDGGGLHDLFGLAVIGRDKTTRDWLLWTRAWAHSEVFDEARRTGGPLRDFIRDGDLVLCERATQDIAEVAAIVERLNQAKLLPAKAAVGIDPAGIAALVDELDAHGVSSEQLVAVQQGYRLSGAIQGLERKLKDGTIWHAGQPLMSWCVGNAKVENRGNAVLVTKQISGRAKIDPLVAAFDAVTLMGRNPEPLRRPEYQIMVFGGRP